MPAPLKAATLCTKQRARRYHQQEDSTRLPTNQAREFHNASTSCKMHHQRTLLPCTPLHHHSCKRCKKSPVAADTKLALPSMPSNTHPASGQPQKPEAEEAVRTPLACRLPPLTRQPSTAPKQHSLNIPRSIARKGRHKKEFGQQTRAHT